MFCCKCGARNPRHAVYCNKCGNSVVEQNVSDLRRRKEGASPPKLPREDGQARLFAELSRPDQKPDQCHACGKKDQLYRWEFGMARELSTRRTWEDTAVSVAVSAITIPLLGVGGFQLPGKKSRLQVLRLQLVLCEGCRKRRVTYAAHPSWELAQKLGYTLLLDAHELSTLQPVRPKK